jgi:predicted peptidase
VQLIEWNVILEDPTPGVHKLRYVIHNFEGNGGTKDVTWMVTVEGSKASPTPLVSLNKQTYPPLSTAINPGQHPYTSSKAQLNFLLYLPEDYGKDPQTKWPVILFLHGAGKVGTNLDQLRSGPLPSNLENQSDFPFIVVSPQLSGESGHEYWPQEAVVNSLLTLMDEIQSTYAVDPNRIYFTGVSLGANGVWEIGLRYPRRFAALAPVMGYYGYPNTVPDNICDLKGVPIWAFHGAKDEIVPIDAEAGLVNALKACGGNIRFTVYPDAHHDIEPQAYATQDLYSWLLGQRLK